MSTNSVVYNNGQFAIINYDVSKIFVWNNRYADANFTNSTYAPIQLYAGMLMGRIATTQKIVPLDSTATDGSQYPVGILHEDALVEEGETVSLSFCTEGDVVKDKVILHGTDTLATLISGRSILDRIGSDTVGVNLINSTEQTGFDNQ